MRDNAPSTHVRPVPTCLPGEYRPGSQPLAEGKSEELPLREYVRIVYKYRLAILTCLAAGALLAMLYGFTATPRYSAESTVRISSYEPILAATRIEGMLQEKSKEALYLETQVQEMKSYSLADTALSDKRIGNYFSTQRSTGLLSWLSGSNAGKDISAPGITAQSTGYKASVEEMKAYLDSIEIRPVRRTSLVIIRATAELPAVAALIANRHALAYIDWVRKNRIDQQSQGLQFLRAQADELREKVADYEREIAAYAEANSIVAVNKDENITVQKMSQLNRLLTETTARRIEAENLFREAESSLNNPSAGFDDVSTQTMRSELARLEAEYQQLSAKFTASYPKVQQLSSQIRGLKNSIQSQRAQVVRGLKAKMLAAREEEKHLSEELERQKSQAFELSRRQVQYNVLNRELTSSRELLQNILRQIKETSLSVESNASNVSVVDYALTPQRPSHPRKILALLMGAVLGLGLGIALAFLLSYLDNSVRTPEDVVQMLGLPSLGVVPAFELDCGPQKKTDPVKKHNSVMSGKEIILATPGQSPVVFLSDPGSLASEAYRTIRTGILLSQAGEPPRTILISSAQSSEGKTTSTINLAASLASTGATVVLVDADLRRPNMHRVLNLGASSPGLVEVITGQRTLAEVALRDVIKRVTFIPSGEIPPNPAELLGSLEMAAIIDELARVFDYVLIDSPPVLPVTDSVILSRYVDGVVLVVRGGVTPRRVVTDAKDRLAGVGARLLGVVLNDVNVMGGDYYYYHRYYHSYYQNEQEGREKKRCHSRDMLM